MNTRDIPAELPPERLAAHDRSRTLAAAHHAKKVWPGPVGELVARELTWHAETGWAYQPDTLAVRLVQHVMTTPLPTAGGAS